MGTHAAIFFCTHPVVAHPKRVCEVKRIPLDAHGLVRLVTYRFSIFKPCFKKLFFGFVMFGLTTAKDTDLPDTANT